MKLFTEDEKRELSAHIAQERLARWAMALAGVAGIAGAFWYGLPSLLLGAAGVAFFHLARPGPSDKIDKWTGR